MGGAEEGAWAAVGPRGVLGKGLNVESERLASWLSCADEQEQAPATR